MSATSASNFYEILKSTSNASYDELKRNYKQLILQCHPDKLQQDKANTKLTTTSTAATAIVETTITAAVAVAAAGDDDNVIDPNAENNVEFLLINEAWNTLKDPAKRKQYDAELLLNKFQTHNNIYERLTLADMQQEQQHQYETDNIVAADDDDVENIAKENDKTARATKYYTYNCRCGGQYIIDDESVAADSTFFNNRNDNGGDNNNDNDDGEVIVECSECSLVIILNG